jgi:predicted RNA-binding Zn-ribbon protein involved in translation (DUF1610 family)
MECELKEKLEDLPDLAEWLDVGGEVPAGRCPACGALAYLERSDNPVIPHLGHIAQLEVAWYGPKDGSEPASVTVECTRCGMVVQEMFNADFETAKCPECGELGYDNADDCSFCQDQREGGIRAVEQQEV